jgi:glycosidase
MFPLVYQINTRLWLEALSRREGHPFTLETVPNAEWDHLAESGFHAVWLMGVWEPSSAARQIAQSLPSIVDECRRAVPQLAMDDVGASPYAITTYRVNRSLGGEHGLRAVRRKLHARGMRLILDFVPNHVALDHPWITSDRRRFIHAPPHSLESHPAWFSSVHGSFLAYGRDPYFPPWTDTLQLNYSERDLQEAMIQQLQAVASLCDGVRCDMAMLVMKDIFNRTWDGLTATMAAEFWPSAIDAVKVRHRDFLFIAEAYWDTGWQLQQMGFDYTYDKTLYDRLCQRDARAVRDHLKSDWAYHKRLLRFVENHDETRAAVRFPEFHRTAALLTLTSPGMRLIHHGQCEGYRVKAPVQLLRAPAENTDEETARFYARLFPCLNKTAMTDGDFTLLDGGAHMVAFERRSGQCTAMTAVNLSTEPAEASIRTRAFENVPNAQALCAVGTLDHHRPQFDGWPGGITVRLRPLEGVLLATP